MDTNPRKEKVSLNLDDIAEKLRLGVRRAHAFMAFGLTIKDAPLPTSAALKSAVRFSFLPEPLPPELASEILAEYQAWLIGGALRELDQFLGHFADSMWFAILAAERNNTTFKPKDLVEAKQRFEANTNTARKIGLIVEKLTAPNVHTKFFESLSSARNALAHGAGLARERDALAEGKLVVRWLGISATFKEGGSVRAFDADKPSFEREGSGAAEIEFEVVERRREFAIGERVDFSPNELSEICFFYDQQGAVLIQAFKGWLQRKGFVVRKV